ncbi:MAG: shikimate dehydrogenase [Bacteroidota bacterium]
MRKFGLIGFPLGHSFSKIFFNNKFKEEGIEDASFELFPIENIHLFPQLIKNDSSLEGLAVTKPYKESVMPYLSEIDDAATQIKAVNCIVIDNGNLIGHNTDVIGFELSFLPLLKSHHQKALILGSGGASKGVQYVLRKIGMDFLLVSRSTSKQKGDIVYGSINNAIMNEYTVIINATSSGMSPEENDCPEIPYECLSPQHLLYDLIYKPAETLFMKRGNANGATVKNGHEMFLIQAEANWKYWNKLTK